MKIGIFSRKVVSILFLLVSVAGCIPNKGSIRTTALSIAEPIAGPGMTLEPSQITVVASGIPSNSVAPHFQLRLGESTVLGDFDASAEFSPYKLSTRLDLTHQDLRIYLTTEGTLTVEMIIINGLTYLATDPKVYGESIPFKSGCQKGSLMTGVMNCPGFLDFPTHLTIPPPIPSESITAQQ